MNQPSLLRHAAVFGLGNVALHAANALLLPVYVRCLQPSEYGLLEMLYRIGEVLAVLLLFGALRQGALTFYRQALDEGQQRRVAGTVLALLIGLNVGGIALIALATGPWFAGYWEGDVGLVRLALIAALLEASSMVLLGLALARLASTFIVAMNLLQLLGRLGLTIGFVLGLEWGVAGVVYACLISSSLFMAAVLAMELRRSGLCLEGRIARELAAFMLPFLPAGLGVFILGNGDRFLLLHFHGEAAVGVYALGYKMAGILFNLIVAPLLGVWMTRIYDLAREPDAATVFGQMTTRLLIGMTFAALGVAILAEEIVQVLAGPTYAPAAQVIPWVMLAYWFHVLCLLQDASFYLRRQMVYRTGVILAAAGVVLVAYLALIPAYAGLGAAAATLIAFTFQCGLSRWLAQRVFPIQYENRRLAIMLLTAVACWAGSLPLPTWAIPGKVACWLCWPAFLWTSGWVRDEEKRWVLTQLQRCGTRLGVRTRRGQLPL